jgi:hypothetical protein
MDDIVPFTEYEIEHIKRMMDAYPPTKGSADWYVARWIATVEKTRQCSDCGCDMSLCPYCDRIQRELHR